MKRRILLAVAALIVVLIVIQVWMVRPLLPRVWTYTANGYSYRVVSTRKAERLPISEWGFAWHGTIGCDVMNDGKHFSTTTRFTKLGWVMITEEEQTN